MSEIKLTTSQVQRQNQQQHLSRQQLLMLKLLECTDESLEQRVTEEVEKNPALDAEAYTSGEVVGDEDYESGGDDSESTQENELSDEEDGEKLSADEMEDVLQGDDGYYQDMDSIHVSSGFEGSSMAQYETTEDAYQMLKRQLSFKELTESQMKLCEYLVDSLDEKGFLTRMPDEIMDDFFNVCGVDVAISEVESAIAVIRTLEPTGVGAYDTRDCLLMQLCAMPQTQEVLILTDIIQNNYRQLVNQNLDAIKGRMNMSDEDFRSVIGLFNKLNPQPLLSLQDTSFSTKTTVSPEFVVTLFDGDVSLSLAGVKLPPLKFSEDFLRMSEDNNTETRLFAKKYLEMAEDFMQALKLRQQTMLTIMTAIIKKQKEYFLTGDSTRLVPMVLQDIADVTGLDPSTVSRVTSNKYVQTPYGIKPLKSLFTVSVTAEDGEVVSRNKVLSILKEIIESEDKSNPYTDTQLSEMMLEQGYDVKRRTISKYRGELGLGTVQMRKIIN